MNCIRIKGVLLSMFVIFFLQLSAQHSINIIPQPISVRASEGDFIIDQNTVIYYDKGAQKTAKYVGNFLRKATGYPLPIISQKGAVKKGFYLQLKPQNGDTVKGAYTLLVDGRGIRLTANKEEGFNR